MLWRPFVAYLVAAAAVFAIGFAGIMGPIFLGGFFTI
jgi:hypothetical protein